MKKQGRIVLLAVAGVLLWSGVRCVAQESAPAQQPAAAQPGTAAPAAEATPAAATPAAAAVTPADQSQQPAAVSPQAPAEAAAPVAAPATAAKPVAPAAAANESKKGFLGIGGKKEVYSGPTEVIVLPPTPMLDEEGKQRLDPDGKPMFNAPVKQQRDKYGHPLFDENNKPVFQTATDLGYDDKGKKLRVEKVKPPKMTPLTVSRGTFTVDGVIAKAALNYDIADLKFIYFYVPGMGVTVISNENFPGSKMQANAFDGPTLTVKADDHTLQLGSDQRLMQSKKPENAYVLVDRDFRLPSMRPEIGYGTTAKSPYQWPGSKENKSITGVFAPPPIPKNLQPTILLAACPKGQMRMPAPKVLPGEKAPDQPCVPIAQAEAAIARAKAATSTSPTATAPPSPSK
jgi:hypothetical protein